MYSGYKDKNGRILNVGDEVILRKDGKETKLTVCFGNLVRYIRKHPSSEKSVCKVKISAFYFENGNYKLFPIIQDDGSDDTAYMEKL